ncbi:MAG: hypothetical protein ACFFDT_01295 [Candidatus Hodarchaeota archaeon]
MKPLSIAPKSITEEERKELQAKTEALMLHAWEIPEDLIPYLLSRFPLLDVEYKNKITEYYEEIKKGIYHESF